MRVYPVKKWCGKWIWPVKNYCSYYSNGKWQQDKEKDISLSRESLGIKGCADILEAAVELKKKMFEVENND